MNKPKYKSVRLLYETYTLLRIEAAKRDIPMAELLRIAVEREAAKTGRMLKKAAGRPAPGAQVCDAPRNGLNRRGRGRP